MVRLDLLGALGEATRQIKKHHISRSRTTKCPPADKRGFLQFIFLYGGGVASVVHPFFVGRCLAVMFQLMESGNTPSRKGGVRVFPCNKEGGVDRKSRMRRAEGEKQEKEGHHKEETSRNNKTTTMIHASEDRRCRGRLLKEEWGGARRTGENHRENKDR